MKENNPLKLTLEEKKIVDLFLKQGMSIRKIADKYGYTRRIVNNVIEKYASASKENAEKVALEKSNQKNHRNIQSFSEIVQVELTDELVELAYNQIIEGQKTLTSISESLGKNRETIKKAILEYLDGDEEAITEFKRILKKNQSFKTANTTFNELGIEEKKKIIFNRLNFRRKIASRSVYPEEMLERKYARLLYFFNGRNSRIEKEQDKISEESLLRMIYDYPTMLTMSLSNKIEPVIYALDNKYLNLADTSHLLRENPGILGTSMTRIDLQMKILKDTKTLHLALKKPRNFRASPEIIYSLIEHWKEHDSKGSPFISMNKLYSSYGETSETIKRKFDVREQYGEDEYFDLK